MKLTINEGNVLGMGGGWPNLYLPKDAKQYLSSNGFERVNTELGPCFYMKFTGNEVWEIYVTEEDGAIYVVQEGQDPKQTDSLTLIDDRDYRDDIDALINFGNCLSNGQDFNSCIDAFFRGDLHTESISRRNKFFKLRKEDINENSTVMEITVSSGISADGCDIEIKQNGKTVFQESYSYGYNASYNRELAHYAHQDFINAKKYGWENKPLDQPYIGDIIVNLCKKYNVTKENIIIKKGKNVFAGTDVPYGDTIEFINWHLPLLIKGAKGVAESYKRLQEKEDIYHDAQKAVYDFFMKKQWDLNNPEVANYADAVAEQLELDPEFANGTYTMRDWYKDTYWSYPEEIEWLDSTAY